MRTRRLRGKIGVHTFTPPCRQIVHTPAAVCFRCLGSFIACWCCRFQTVFRAGCRTRRRTKTSIWRCCCCRNSSAEERSRTSCSKEKSAGRSSFESYASPSRCSTASVSVGRRGLALEVRIYMLVDVYILFSQAGPDERDENAALPPSPFFCQTLPINQTRKGQTCCHVILSTPFVFTPPSPSSCRPPPRF